MFAQLASAREKVAQATAQLGNDSSALGNLAAEVEADQAELDRFQQFLDLIDRAYQAETAPLVEPAFEADAPVGEDFVATVELPATKIVSRRPAAAVPFLLDALQRYDVLARDDWESLLQGGFLAPQQIDQIRSVAYEVLLWLADDVVRRKQEHPSEQNLSADAAARAGLVYLDRAGRAKPPTHALYVLRARCHQALGEDATAQTDTQLAAHTPPTTAFDHFLRGKAALNAEKLAEGVEAFEAALRVEPTHYWSLMNLGYCLGDLGQEPADFAAAAKVYTGCILKRPDHAHAYYCRANACYDLQRYEEALADYSKAVELDPRHSRAWHRRGLLHNTLNERDQALVDLDKAVTLVPDAANIWYSRGVTHSKLGRQDKALADFTRATELAPGSARYWAVRGLSHTRLNQPDKGLADFDQAIQLDPLYSYAWCYRGFARCNLGRPREALADFDRAIELDPREPFAWRYRGVAYCMLGRQDRAIADYDKAIDLDPLDPYVWAGRAMANLRAGRPDKALGDFAKSIELNPNNAIARFNLGLTYNRLNQPEKARDEYSAAIELAPSHVRSHNNLAWLLATCADATLRDPGRAVEVAKKAVQLAPRDGSYWNTLGVAHYRAGDWQAAIAALDKAIELRSGGDAYEQLFLAMCHWKLGEHDKARAAYEQATAWLEKQGEAGKKQQEGSGRTPPLPSGSDRSPGTARVQLV